MVLLPATWLHWTHCKSTYVGLSVLHLLILFNFWLIAKLLLKASAISCFKNVLFWSMIALIALSVVLREIFHTWGSFTFGLPWPCIKWTKLKKRKIPKCNRSSAVPSLGEKNNLKWVSFQSYLHQQQLWWYFKMFQTVRAFHKSFLTNETILQLQHFFH